MELEGRIRRFQDRIRKFYDAALLTPSTNFFYLSGLAPVATLERPFILLIPSEGEPCILAPALYSLELKDAWIKNVILWKDEEDPFKKLADMFGQVPRKTGKILVEDTMPAGFLLSIEKNIEYEFEPLGQVIKEFRIRKSEEELRYLKKAAEIVDKVFYALVAEGLEGRTEVEVAKKIGDLIYEYGGEGISFEPIVASGPNGANPHYMPGRRVIKRGDVVILDYGAKYRGYCSDITRTVVIGKATEEIRGVYEIVKNAQENAFLKSSNGVKARDIDMAARDYITSHGYGGYFTHRTGHGLGLDVHEPPFITANNDEPIEDGMVFTIEPGIYLPNKFGIRIEDDVAIIDGKGVRLTTADRELMEVR